MVVVKGAEVQILLKKRNHKVWTRLLRSKEKVSKYDALKSLFGAQFVLYEGEKAGISPAWLQRDSWKIKEYHCKLHTNFDCLEQLA